MPLPSFEFRTVPSLEVSWGAAQRLGDLLAQRFPQRNALLVTDAGLVKAGLITPIAESLTSAGFSLTLFDGVVADPPEEVLHRCVAQARAARANLVLGLGGGSSLDIAKLAAVLLASDQPLSDMYGIGKVTGSRLPLALIPTTAGTGSEVTNISILTTGETTKMGVVSPQLYADYVLLDAQLTLGLPRLHTAATGIDAMVHAIEAYTTKHKKNPLSDALAREALRLLAANLLPACNEPTSRTARENMLLGATLAGQAFANAPVAAVHALAYPLGGHFHIPHGLSNALMLAPVLRFNAPAAAPLYAELAATLGLAPHADALISHLQSLLHQSGAPCRLRDLSIPESALPLLATDAMKQTRLLSNNPIEIQHPHALALYQQAF